MVKYFYVLIWIRLEDKTIPFILTALLLGISISLVSVYADNNFVLPPLKQSKIDIPINEINCRDNFILILKNQNNNPACVKQSSLNRLTNDGWHLPEDFTQSNERKELKISITIYDSFGWCRCYSSYNITSTEISIHEGGRDIGGNERPETRESYSISDEEWSRLTSSLNIVKFYSLPDIMEDDGFTDGASMGIYVTYGNAMKSVYFGPGSYTPEEVSNFLSELDLVLEQYRHWDYNPTDLLVSSLSYSGLLTEKLNKESTFKPEWGVGQVIGVGREYLHVFTFSTIGDAKSAEKQLTQELLQQREEEEEQRGLIREYACDTWFYRVDYVIALFISEHQRIKQRLDEILGPPFEGYWGMNIGCDAINSEMVRP